MFHPCEYHQAAERRLLTSTGEILVVDPGRVFLLQTVSKFLDSARGITTDDGLIDFSCAIADPSGVLYRYHTILSPLAVFPPRGVLCERATGGALPDTTASIRPRLDPRGIASFPLAGGGRLSAGNDQDGLVIQLRETGSGLDAKLTLYSLATAKGAFPTTGESVEYSIPVEHLLWRAGPLYAQDTVVPEAAGHIEFDHRGTASKLGLPLKRSRIRLEARREGGSA